MWQGADDAGRLDHNLVVAISEHGSVCVRVRVRVRVRVAACAWPRARARVRVRARARAGPAERGLKPEFEVAIAIRVGQVLLTKELIEPIWPPRTVG